MPGSPLTTSPHSAVSPVTQPELAPTRRDAARMRALPERVSWEELGPDFYQAWGFPHGEWMPEHLAIYGPTGSGKSFFEVTVLKERARLRGDHVVVIATKPADKTVAATGWPIVHRWPPAQGWRDKHKYEQVVFWAKAKGLNAQARTEQAILVEDLLDQLWVPDSNIIVSFDEIAYVDNQLGLKTHVETYFREGRTMGITVVASTQRPSNVTRFMHSEATWSVFFAPKDEDDAERMAQVAGNKNYYLRVLPELRRDKHEFLLVHNLTNEAHISRLPRSGRVPVPVQPKSPQVDPPHMT